MAGIPEKDAISGQSTTGHEWDGITELNTPLPAWWVWVFYATIVWALAYVVVYPAIPLGASATPGLFGWHSRTELQKDMNQAYQAFHADKVARIESMDVDAIIADDPLRQYATRAGEVIFKENCAPCHQSGGAGNYGYPTLADDEWLWGGTADAIYTTVRHGIRDTNTFDDTRFNEMPSFAELPEEDLNALADYVVAASTGSFPAGHGQQLFEENCAVCHASESSGPVPDGNQALGAPALNNQIWLYKGDKDSILAQLRAPKQGMMPGWANRLKDSDIKSATVYVHSLGGGQ
ncbi:cytochrome-c oxidase, cbb3-type subunit III [Rhodospirillum rubrum]|uniref:cytochrome-c oxidase, cbb3-type subunit III n=1 Tax=Rhodospirillum rubrum TaxID=1085 RepID=UPI00190524C4|nr:cytochrome-c oxidase, cbb3-type subunit III [Rhodospirillum rubrum]MBK1664508.1 cytochrome-c oxidase, cbb3-type subunit III [Rhodospirillum rubrum]MBK1676237.1 cytochrome-c oxidase, cbb3-type subunit III [Rhodospirillum rubrum]